MAVRSERFSALVMITALKCLLRTYTHLAAQDIGCFKEVAFELG